MTCSEAARACGFNDVVCAVCAWHASILVHIDTRNAAGAASANGKSIEPSANKLRSLKDRIVDGDLIRFSLNSLSVKVLYKFFPKQLVCKGPI